MHAVHGRSRDLLHHPVLPRHRPVLSGCKTGIACVPAERAGRSGVSSSPTMVKGVAHVAGPRRQGSEQRRQRAPHLAEVLQKLSVKRFTATSCNGLRTPGEPRVFGLTSFAISRPSELTQRCSRQDRTSALIFFRASLLIAGRNAVNCTPSPRRARRGRNVNPRNVNDVCSYEPRRLASLQYTILVLSGCNSSPTSAIRSCSAARTLRAWYSPTQWITASSAYLSNVTSGNSLASHRSNA